ncbi:MAG TPA: adenylate/guanylate cyclase domain-containing protein, partial [Leptospiraceae bacterium]|nr:adenylate/guanylate cyclase domain-containing protein [Leptospiraceae bacterium]
MSLTLEEFLKLYPWEEKYTANKPNRMDWFWNFELEIEPNSLWPFISDTSRLNQAMGLSKMTFEEKEGILYGKAKNAGIDLEWIEVPWNWVSGKYLVSIREYSKGFAYTVKAIFHLEKINDKTTKLY